MKLMEKMRQKKLGNKGFSLVELIIVIAIMAILLGIVGTQVIPYLTRAREQRDAELLSAVCTAAVTAYSTNAGDFTDTDFTYTLFIAPTDTDAAGKNAKALHDHINEFLSFDALSGGTSNIIDKMVSSKGKSTTKITIEFDFSKNTVTVEADSGLDKVESQL